MATLLFQAAGAALGSVFGPIGAIVGRAVGALAGSVVDRSLMGGGGGDSRTISGTRPLPSREEFFLSTAKNASVAMLITGSSPRYTYAM